MTTKKAKRSARSVKSLKAKGLTGNQAKSVKGGIIVVCNQVSAKVMPAGLSEMPQGPPNFKG